MSIQLSFRDPKAQELEREYWKLPYGAKYRSALADAGQLYHHLEVIDAIKTDLNQGLTIEQSLEKRLEYCTWLLKGVKARLKSHGWAEPERKDDAIEFTDPWPLEKSESS